MTTKMDAKQRSRMLKKLRTQHKETVAKTQARLKEQSSIRKQICLVLRKNPSTVPEVAEVVGIPSHEVLWHITAMKKYGRVIEGAMCGEYFLYEMGKEDKV